MYTSQIWVLILLVIYVIGCGGLAVLLIDSSSKIHALLCLFGTIFIGVGILIYRALRGIRSRIVKYVHLLIQTVAVIILVVGFILLDNKNKENYANVHPIPSLVIYGSIAIQYIAALFLFVYLYENRRMRLYFAPFHDIFGIWIYICLAGVCIAALEPFSEKKDDILGKVLIGAGFSCFLIVFVIVLSPFFEWELVGRI